MKKAVLAVILVVTATTAWALDHQRPPEDRITLQNGVPQVIDQLTLPPQRGGRWNASGIAITQVNTTPGADGEFIYCFAWLTTNPNVIPHGKVGMDARPYGTWWFPNIPVPHGIQANPAGGTVVYLMAAYYGQESALEVEVFGGIDATPDEP